MKPTTKLLLPILMTVVICANIEAEKIVQDDLVKNYAEFFNFGVKKPKLSIRRENMIIKSKVDILGEVFKAKIGEIKANDRQLDIVFLIDASSSIGEHNFQNELKFVKKFLSDVVVDYNHSRVAVVTYSSANKIIKSIDEISNPKEENNKCLLLNNQINNITYTGGGTYTVGAFEIAKDIFAKSRNTSRKVLFLITDGFSNGGNPVDIAKQLKADNVTIFTIGIRNGNFKELYQLSSTPGEYHSFLLDSFNQFESLARRALHVDLQTGEYIPLGTSKPCASLCKEGNCCDDKALCACGTSTGHYSCICQPGYYGSGLKNDCSPCPKNTFSNGPNLCLPCPVNHDSEPGSIGPGSCHCKEGYQPTSDKRCEVLKCQKLSPPDHGYFVKKKECANVVNSACGIRCEVGYTLEGTSIRLCQHNATWSGLVPTCQVRTCGALTAPAHGTMTCKHVDLDKTYTKELDLPVDTVCLFVCLRGRTLVGSRQRTCLPLAHWDGLKTSCKQVKCNKLPKVQFGKIEPKSCQTGKQQFGKKCNYTCEDGFKLVGTKEKICSGLHGNWNVKTETKCKDITKPKLVCPENIRKRTAIGKNYGHVTWTPVAVSDNSGLNVTIWTRPSIGDIPNFKFKIGTTNITYFAQDFQRNVAKCSFLVEIYDDEKPTIENCKDPPPYLSPDKSGTNITWDEPEIYDNSQNVKVEKSHDFGFFEIGTTSVTYTASDYSNNTNVCILNITVEEAFCEYPPDPAFGQSECKMMDTGVQCVITCQEGYAVPISFQTDTIDISSGVQYVCSNDNPQWMQDNIYPECTMTEIPLELTENVTIYIEPNNTEDICSNTSKLSELNKNVANDIRGGLSEACNEIDCDLKTVTECEDELYEETSNIIKRDVQSLVEPKPKKQKKRKKIKVKVHVKAKNKREKRKRLGRIRSDVKNMQSLDGNPVTSVRFEVASITCPDGCVLRKQKCVRCPLGSFHNATKNVCQSCELGTYADKEGLSECVSCPNNFSTRRLHSKSKLDCIEKCPPGKMGRKRILKSPKSHPNSVIERITLPPYCRSCPIGEYQDQYGEYKCLKCPDGYTTADVGSTSKTDCIPTVESRCSNSSICNNGKCVVINNFYYSCDCDQLYIGSHCETKINSCSHNPCTNGGTCILTDDATDEYSCQCPEGYHGPNCEIIEEKCSLKCLNNGTCLQSDEGDFCSCPDGYGGETCETKLSYCLPNICENNSTCVEDVQTFRCLCTNGFLGKRCTDLPCDSLPCPANAICENLPKENASRKDFRCDCIPGFTGVNCTEKIKPCTKNNCQNQALCRNANEELYICECTPGFYGDFCEFEAKGRFVLSFTRAGVTDSVRLDGFKFDLKEISVCSWIHTLDNFNYGTVLSYATRRYDNAFTITDYAGLVFYINNKSIITDIKLNDGRWHYFSFTWSSLTGNYVVYVDGKPILRGSEFSVGEILEADGKMVIGQEQDVMGGRFSQSEAFLGQLTEFNVWSKVLSPEEIQLSMDSCKAEMFGDVYPWPTLNEHIVGNVENISSPFCQFCKQPNPLFNGRVEIIDNVAHYHCNKGYVLGEGEYKHGRKCNKATEWEGDREPFCKSVYCGYPGFLRHGRIIGRQYQYLGEIKYVCNSGYTLKGEGVRTCSENGTWVPDEPTCEGLRCKSFKPPRYSNLSIISDYSDEYEDNLDSYDVGTSVQILCDDNTKTIGEDVLTCNENGEWDFPIPECVPTQPKAPDISCPLSHIPAAPNNGYMTEESMDAVKNGTSNIVEYRCGPGYQLIGENATTCIIDGYWTEPNISCELVKCPKPPRIKNGKISKLSEKSFQFGNMLTYECLPGFKLHGDPMIRCTATGRWTRIRARCNKISCGKPDVLESTDVSGEGYLYSDEVVLTCANGETYNLKCDGKGAWIGDKHTSC